MNETLFYSLIYSPRRQRTPTRTDLAASSSGQARADFHLPVPGLADRLLSGLELIKDGEEHSLPNRPTASEKSWPAYANAD